MVEDVVDTGFEDEYNEEVDEDSSSTKESGEDSGDSDYIVDSKALVDDCDKVIKTMRLDQFVVNLREMACTCRYWEITGIIWKHAVCAIWDKILNGENAQDPEQWVHPCYKLDTWKAMYFNKIDPINGRTMWPRSDCPTTLVAPKHHIPVEVGRPKKKRRRAADEPKNQTRKLSRKFLTVICVKCHNKGHNSRTCKGQGGSRQNGLGASSQGGVGSSSQGVGGSSQQGVAAARARQKIPFQRPRARG
ncbi:hypothetical protein LXL04_006576 [Taraxacum kok-saghyz]